MLLPTIPGTSGATSDRQRLAEPHDKLDCSCHEGATTNIDARSESKAQRPPPAATASEAARAPRLHLTMIFQWFCKEMLWFMQRCTNHSGRKANGHTNVVVLNRNALNRNEFSGLDLTRALR